MWLLGVDVVLVVPSSNVFWTHIDSVVIVEYDPSALTWIDNHQAKSRLLSVIGDAADEGIAEQAADLASTTAPFTGWVNNAAIFRDASIHTAPVTEILSLISQNLHPAVVGCTVAIRRFLSIGRGGAIVNISSHQANRAVSGCMPYVTAKAATEGMTRALAVEYGAQGIRVNTVALGSISTERYEAYLHRQTPEDAQRIEHEMSFLHPIGRVGRSHEVADAVAYLLSPEASYITGVTLPVDGGRSVLGYDPEAHTTI